MTETVGQDEAQQEPAAQTIGFVGLGSMGLPMALNLLAHGYRVRGTSRDADRRNRFSAAGGELSDGVAGTVTGADVVITMLPEGGVVREVVDQEDGVAANVRPGTTLIDMSTIDPEDARWLARRCDQLGIDFLDAPVSGGVGGAEAGTLTIMVGGRSEALRRARPVLEAMGTTITHLGAAGSGQVVKAANQMIVGANLAVLGEAVLMLERSGVDPEQALEALAGGLAGSRVMQVKGTTLVKRDFTPTFTAGLHAKDMRIAQAVGRSVDCVLPVTETVTQVLHAAVANGLADQDHAAVIRVAELLSGTEPMNWK